MTYDKSNKLHIVAVTAVIRNRAGKYLVLKRHPREVAFPECYCFPGGKVEANETIEQALAKEVAEETGLVMKPGKILLKDAAFIRPDGQTVKVLAYLCEVEDDSLVKIDENDFTEYQWITAEDLKQLPNVGIEEEINQAEKLLTLGISLENLFTPSSPQK